MNTTYHLKANNGIWGAEVSTHTATDLINGHSCFLISCIYKSKKEWIYEGRLNKGKIDLSLTKKGEQLVEDGLVFDPGLDVMQEFVIKNAIQLVKDKVGIYFPLTIGDVSVDENLNVSVKTHKYGVVPIGRIREAKNFPGEFVLKINPEFVVEYAARATTLADSAAIVKTITSWKKKNLI